MANTQLPFVAEEKSTESNKSKQITNFDIRQIEAVRTQASHAMTSLCAQELSRAAKKEATPNFVEGLVTTSVVVKNERPTLDIQRAETYLDTQVTQRKISQGTADEVAVIVKEKGQRLVSSVTDGVNAGIAITNPMEQKKAGQLYSSSIKGLESIGIQNAEGIATNCVIAGAALATGLSEAKAWQLYGDKIAKTAIKVGVTEETMYNIAKHLDGVYHTSIAPSLIKNSETFAKKVAIQTLQPYESFLRQTGYLDVITRRGEVEDKLKRDEKKERELAMARLKDAGVTDQLAEDKLEKLKNGNKLNELDISKIVMDMQRAAEERIAASITPRLKQTHNV